MNLIGPNFPLTFYIKLSRTCIFSIINFSLDKDQPLSIFGSLILLLKLIKSTSTTTTTIIMARLTKKQQQRAQQAEEERKNRESEEIQDSDATLEEAVAKEDKGKGTRKKTTVSLQKRNRKDLSEDSTADSEVSSSSSSIFNRKKEGKVCEKKPRGSQEFNNTQRQEGTSVAAEGKAT